MKAEILHHWNYFLSIERDLDRLRNYVELAETNSNAYSMELSKILQLSCAEIDSVSRMLCKHIDPTKDYYDEATYSGNISLYKPIIYGKYSNIHLAEVVVPGYSSRIQPWSDWQNTNSPQWWVEYNLVKHYRHSSYQKANLGNAVLSISALMILLMYFYRDVDGRCKANPSPRPVLLDTPYTSGNMVCSADNELPGF